MQQEETMQYDLAIVGAGPAGLSAAIRFKQLCRTHNVDYRVCLLEKGAAVGAHILSGAVINPGTLNQLIPDWQQRNAPIHTPATRDAFYYLTAKRAYRLPTPPQMRNHGNYIVSLSKVCRWLAEVAEQLGVEIYPGFPAKKILYNAEKTRVMGIVTGAFGLDKANNPTDNYQPGIAIQAQHTLFAEGCRGSLSQQLIHHYQLQTGIQTYALGIKELWKIAKQHHRPGTVIHTVGWPLPHPTYGGSFIYHLEDDKIALGLVIGLDYRNPWLNPFQELQRFKTHLLIRKLLQNGERISYGARSLNEGGYQAIPKLTFPGGALIGDSAGFLNVAQIKGTHNAMLSGMLAAEAVFDQLRTQQTSPIHAYQERVNQSRMHKELYQVRNIRPGFRWGLLSGLVNAAFTTISRGYEPWTLQHTYDYQSLQPAQQAPRIRYPKPDNQLMFDLPSSVYLSNTHHTEHQPCHLQLHEPHIAIDTNLRLYAAPEQRYCPAGVYEITKDENRQPRLQINAQNCIHCKACDIKDPRQNITWVTPEGGGGPNYSEM